MSPSPPTPRQIVRRCSLAGLACGVAFALVVVPTEFNYLCRRADGAIGPRTSEVFTSVAKGPDGKLGVNPAAQSPVGVAGPCTGTKRSLTGCRLRSRTCCSSPSSATRSAAVEFDLRERARPLSPEQMDYDDSMRTNRPPFST